MSCMTAVQPDLFIAEPPPPAPPVERSWKEMLKGEREAPYMQSVMPLIEKERAAEKIISPPNSEIFASLQRTAFMDVKVVIIGQDPYHGPNQAHGLCFSVRPPTPPPPSLQNIFK